MSNVRMDLVELYPSGMMPSGSAVYSDSIITQNIDGAAFILDAYPGGSGTASGLLISPQYYYGDPGIDRTTYNDAAVPSGEENWAGGTVGVFDSVAERLIFHEDISKIVLTASTPIRRVFTIDTSGAYAVRLKIESDGTPQPEDSMKIRGSRIMSHYTGKRMY